MTLRVTILTGMVCFSCSIFGQNVGVNTDGSNPVSMLHVKTLATAGSDGLLIENPNGGNGDAILTFRNNGNTDEWTLGFDDSDADDFKISQSATLGTTNALTIDGGTRQILAGTNGSAADPVWSFENDNNTGIYLAGGDLIGMSTAGAERFRIDNSFQVQAMGDGTAALPFYSWNSDQNTGIWRAGADAMAISTAGSERMRFLNNGEVVVGATVTVIPDDLFAVVSRAGLDFAVNGYSAFNGSGVYGQVTSGNTPFAAVQGEYVGTSRFGAGVAGITYTTTAGTDFDGNTVSGIYGSLATGNLARSFGVLGDVGSNFNRRTGGVIGTDFFARGALGYYAQNNNDYSVYGFGAAFQNGGAGGIIQNPNGSSSSMNKSASSGNGIQMGQNAQIGLGAYGGVMGGWIKGIAYGANFSGNIYGSYTDGQAITNDVMISLTDVGEEERIASYSVTSTSVDVYDKGNTTKNGTVTHVDFSTEFSKLLSENEAVIVTVTPLSSSNGLFVKNITNNGFDVEENANGTNTVQFNWIAVGARKGFENTSVSQEVLDDNFDSNMHGVMWNDDVDATEPKGIWWTGTEVQFGNIPEKVIDPSILERLNSVTRHKPGK